MDKTRKNVHSDFMDKDVSKDEIQSKNAENDVLRIVCLDVS